MCRVSGVVCSVWCVGCSVQSLGCMVKDAGCGVHGVVCRVWGALKGCSHPDRYEYSGVTLNVARPDMNNYARLGVMLY